MPTRHAHGYLCTHRPNVITGLSCFQQKVPHDGVGLSSDFDEKVRQWRSYVTHERASQHTHDARVCYEKALTYTGCVTSLCAAVIQAYCFTFAISNVHTIGTKAINLKTEVQIWKSRTPMKHRPIYANMSCACHCYMAR